MDAISGFFNYIFTKYNTIQHSIVKIMNYPLFDVRDPKSYAWIFVCVYMVSFICVLGLFFRYVDIYNLAQILDNESSDEDDEDDEDDPMDDLFDDTLGDESLGNPTGLRFRNP